MCDIQKAMEGWTSPGCFFKKTDHPENFVNPEAEMKKNKKDPGVG